MESKNKKMGVSQKAIIFNKNGKILTIRRTKTAPSRPLHWDLPGGLLEFGEDTKDAIIREVKEETNLKIKNPIVMDARSKFSDNGEFWVTICYVARSTDKKVILSYEHDDIKWVTPNGFQKLKASPKNKKFVKYFKSWRTKNKI